MALLFEAGAFNGGDERGMKQALSEAHAEIGELRRSVRDSLAREDVWRRRAELLERQLRRRR